MNTKEIGNKTEAMFLAEFLKFNVSVSIPFGNSEPYDVVIKTKEGFKSVQIKHAKYSNGCVVAYIKKFVGYRKRTTTTYQGLCDYIALWCEELNKFYLIPIDDCGKRGLLHLRLVPTQSGVKQTIIWAEQYELERQIKNII